MTDALLSVIIKGVDAGASTTLKSVLQETLGLSEGQAALGVSMLAATGAAMGMTEAFKLVKEGIASVIEQSAAWQTQLSQAQANTTLTTDQTQAMGDAIIKMSEQSGSSLADLGAGYVHISNLLGSAADATKVLDIAQQSAVSTGGKVSDYAQTLARVLKEYGASADEAAKYMDTLHTAAANADLTLEQFTANSGTSLAAGANYGVAIDQIAAAYTTLTVHGMDAAQANTQITDGLLRLTNVTPKVATELERVSKLTGVDLTSDFTAAGVAAKGYTGILADLRQAETDMSMSSGEAYRENMLLGDALRGGQGLAILAGNGYQDYIDKLAAADNTAASAAKRQEDYARALETTGTQWDILKAKMAGGIAEMSGPVNQVGGGILGTINDIIGGVGTMVGTIGAGFANANKDSGDFFGEFAQRSKAYVDAANGDSNATAALVAYDQQLSHMQSDMSGTIDTATSALLRQQAAMQAQAGGASSYSTPALMDASNAGYDARPDLGTKDGVAAVEAIAKEAGAAQVQADKDAKAQLKTNFDQALTDAKQHYADQKQTALDAATATKEIATTAAQDELDATKTGIEGEKKAYDERAQADIKARQDQTKAALQSLADQNTAANVAAAAANTAAGVAAQAANTRATAEAAAANTRANVEGAAAQHAADESDTRWKASVTAIKDAATSSKNALHTSNDAILKSDVDTANDAYNAQITAIDAELKAREEGDARAIHSHELATASAIAGIESQKTADLRAVDDEIRAHEEATKQAIAGIESEKTSALRAVDEETKAYQAQEAAKLAAISATASAQVKALNDSLADEKRANTERLDINRVTKASGAGAGQELGAYFTATDAQIADTEAAIAAKAAGNQKLAEADTAAAAKQAATAQAASDQLSAINQATADQMVAYKLQTDSTLTADNVTAITQQANDQKAGLAAQLADFKQTEADKKKAITDSATSQKQALSDELTDFKQTDATKKQTINDSAADRKSTLTQELASYKYAMAQSLQAFKDDEAEKKREDKATLDATLTNIATWQAAENARHADALLKINTQAKADIAAIDALAIKRHDEYTAEVARRAADFTAANAARAADYTAATAQRTADYTAKTAARLADYTDAVQTINASSAADITAMQKALKEANDDFAKRTKAADDHHKQEQADIAATYKADTDAINDAATKHNAALADRSKHMTDYTTATDLSWQQLIGDAQAYAAAIGAAGTPGSFHAPGKGPQTFIASDFQAAGDAATSAYTGVYGDNAAAKWAADATANAAKGGGLGPPLPGGGSSPDGTNTARGQAIVSAAQSLSGSRYWDGSASYCETFVEDAAGTGNRGATALDAWAGWGGAQQHGSPKPGDILYFNYPPFGHAGIYEGSGMMRSALTGGVQDMSVADYIKYNNAPMLGYVQPYEYGGVVPGAYGQPSLAIVHGGEEYLGMQGQRGTLAGRGSDAIDYRQLAEAIVDALDRRPATIHVDGQALGNITRTDGRRFNATSLPNGVGGL